MFPVVSQKALKSGTEPGSVASTSSLAPLGSSDSAFLVFSIGQGQTRPLVSRVLSGIALFSGAIEPAAYINEAKRLAMLRRRFLGAPRLRRSGGQATMAANNGATSMPSGG